jgi:hypothetical protein
MKRLLFVVLVASLLLITACTKQTTPPVTDTFSDSAITVDVTPPTLPDETLTAEIQDTEEPDLGSAV